MSETSDRPSFEPVLLDLSDNDDYTVIIHALEEYEGNMLHEAATDLHMFQHEGLPESHSQAEEFKKLANRARALIVKIDEQIDANSEARNSRP